MNKSINFDKAMMTFAYQCPTMYSVISERGFVFDNTIDSIMRDTGTGPIHVHLERFDALDFGAQIGAIRHVASGLASMPWRRNTIDVPLAVLDDGDVIGLPSYAEPDVAVLEARVAELEAENAALREAAAKKHETIKRMAENIREYMENVDKMRATMTTIHSETARQLAATRKPK